MLIKYKEFSPTQFDPKGLNLDDQQDWLVAPAIISRDNDALSRANFEAIKERLEGKDEWEEHSFNHWAFGWFNIIIVKPGTDAEEELNQIVLDLEEHPVLDEDLFLQYDYTDESED